MSNVTIVQELYAAFSRGDIATVIEGLADDVIWEYEGPAVIKSSGIRRGKHEVKGFFLALAEQASDAQLTIDEYVGSGDSVATIGRFAATARETGKKIDTPIAHFWKFRDGKVIRYNSFSNTAAVAEAVMAKGAGAAG